MHQLQAEELSLCLSLSVVPHGVLAQYETDWKLCLLINYTQPKWDVGLRLKKSPKFTLKYEKKKRKKKEG